MARAAIIAALYVVISLVFTPFSFGAVQVRVSEALTMLVVICPEAIVGVTLGCFISNMIGSVPIDMVVGPLVTLLAALVTYKLRNIRWHGLPLLASLPPVLFNAVIIGIELTLLYYPTDRIGVYLFNILTVGIGQIISCSVLGVLLVKVIEKNPHLLALMTDTTKKHPT